MCKKRKCAQATAHVIVVTPMVAWLNRYWSFEKAFAVVQPLKLKNHTEWRQWSKKFRPDGIPATPDYVYKPLAPLNCPCPATFPLLWGILDSHRLKMCSCI